MSEKEIDSTFFNLPVSEIIHEVKNELSNANTLIVSAPPGAGKSTLLPLTLINEPWLNHKKIILLEPRRLAAKSIAIRMASMLKEDVGLTIGYRIRFETRVSEKTKIEVVTEGILTRMLQQDNSLESVGLVIFDEFHERSIHADLALALCREAQQILRPDLRILIMSATLNLPKLKELLNTKIIESQGKLFPVELIYKHDADLHLLPELTSELICEAIKKQDGDVLVFLPGEAEIKKCEELLSNRLKDYSIHPLYGLLPTNEQYLAIVPNDKGKRKIVLATSIAETSLTIEGIKIVIDSGFTRRNVFDIKSGLSKLETVKITLDTADQRAGRAGRLSEGVCYRMWTSATHHRLLPHRTPEIEQSDLSALLLELYCWGVNTITDLCWLSLPPKAAIDQANELLQQIEAIAENKITKHGKKIHELNCHPRIANMLLQADTEELKQLATDVAAIIEERDPLSRESGVDLNLRIEALRRNRSQNNLSYKFARIEKNASYYRNLINTKLNNSSFDPCDTGLLLSFAYPERIASAKPGNNAQFMLANGKMAMFSHTDELANEKWICVANMDMRDTMGKIFLAAPLRPIDLKSKVKEVQEVFWDNRKGELVATNNLKIGGLIIQSKPISNPDKKLVKKAICDIIKKDADLVLNFDDQTNQLFNRLASFKLWNPEVILSVFNKTTLVEKVENWIEIYLDRIKKTDDFKKIKLTDVIESFMDWETKNKFNYSIPDKITVPSGSKIPISYSENGSNPILSVRIQELFGLSETPKINNGKIKLVISLLSPGYKPVQVTSDLVSFWNNAYKDVKKELQRRYPKHSWPDNPMDAKAVKKGNSIK